MTRLASLLQGCNVARLACRGVHFADTTGEPAFEIEQSVATLLSGKYGEL